MKNMKQIIIFLVAIISSLVAVSLAYPSGAPKCSQLVPKHESHKPQTSASPYQVTASKTGSSTASVSISGSSNFKGFLLYATKPGSNDMIGTFTTNDKSKELNCGSSGAATHKNDDAKSSITLTWNAPDKFSGDVEFKASVVKEFKEFWSGLKSPKLTF